MSLVALSDSSIPYLAKTIPFRGITHYVSPIAKATEYYDKASLKPGNDIMDWRVMGIVTTDRILRQLNLVLPME